MFLEKRVYQGSSGRVYPLPFIDRIAVSPHVRLWDAIHIENEYVRLMVLTEIGGRIHIGYDKTNGYDFFYRQNVIKPALVGLAGPWISGGVEFNWPQHHRPATYMPVEAKIEECPDGSAVVWCSDHDPMLRMKGMHGVCLRPGSSAIELKVRLYNRTGWTQTFLWWANVATRVHEKYQSFFPPDVRYVADHAKRAITSFPLSDGSYYGIDYAGRATDGVPEEQKPRHFVPDGSYAANDLSWYANIPVPTSYMITGTAGDFFGGYDHAAKAGMVHVASHHIAPGKKQWTWGNHDFGYAWDRSLSDFDGPYIELMAGVYTDNQPDFSFLAPWETKTFSQFWYPLHDLGVPQAANTEAAIRVVLHDDGTIGLAAEVTRSLPNVTVQLLISGNLRYQWNASLEVGSTFRRFVTVGNAVAREDVSVKLLADGCELLVCEPVATYSSIAPAVAKEPLEPNRIESVEELYLTGLHLEQYRHATRDAQPYWEEALRRDPGDSRTLNAYGLWRSHRGQFEEAIDCFSKAIKRLTALNPNSYDGEPLYNLGQASRLAGKSQKAYDAFYKSTWNSAWRAPAYFALAELDCIDEQWGRARDHLERSLKAEADNLNARNLLVYVLRQNGEATRAAAMLESTLALDPLDIGSQWQLGNVPKNGQQRIDLSFDLLRSGRVEEATEVLEAPGAVLEDGSAPIIALLLAEIYSEADSAKIPAILQAVDEPRLDYCFPHRLEELLLLRRTIAKQQHLWWPNYLLGNLFYDKKRYPDAIDCWEKAAGLRPGYPVVWRNLGIAYFNVRKDIARALLAFERAFGADRNDGRIFYERDQLWKRVGRTAHERLMEFEAHRTLVATRDDLFVELATLFNQRGQPAEALDLITSRPFQPWEGGEGLVLAQYVRARNLLGQAALAIADVKEALLQFHAAFQAPSSLGEAKHVLANQSDLFFWLGVTYDKAGEQDLARHWFMRAAMQKHDFQRMSVRTVSAMTFWSGLAQRRLMNEAEAQRVFTSILQYAEKLEREEPKLDYFATSLPAMLLFEDDLATRNLIEVLRLKGQAMLGLGSYTEAEVFFENVLKLDPNDAMSRDILDQWAKFAMQEQAA